MNQNVEQNEGQAKSKDGQEKQEKARQDLHAAAVEAAYLLAMRTR